MPDHLEAVPDAPEGTLGAWGDPSTTASAPQDLYETVRYFGATIRVVMDRVLVEISLEEFLEVAMNMDENDARSGGVVRSFLRTLIHPEDFGAFWAQVKRHRQDMAAQMAFGMFLVEKMTGHPSMRPSDSSDGPRRTGPESADDVSLRAQRRLEEQGRPDLAVAVLARRQAAATG